MYYIFYPGSNGSVRHGYMSKSQTLDILENYACFLPTMKCQVLDTDSQGETKSPNKMVSYKMIVNHMGTHIF